MLKYTIEADIDRLLISVKFDYGLNRICTSYVENNVEVILSFEVFWKLKKLNILYYDLLGVVDGVESTIKVVINEKELYAKLKNKILWKRM